MDHGESNTNNTSSDLSALYAFGSNGSGQLGIGNTEDTAAPIQVSNSGPQKAHIVSIACGGNHTVVLYSNGDVATTGDNSDGRCVTTTWTQSNKLSPAMIRAGEVQDEQLHIVTIAATWSSTLLVSSESYLLSCGTGTSGELGLGKDVTSAPVPTMIKAFPPPDTRVVKMASSMAHTIAVLSNGEVWGWGRGRQGQLGFPLEHRWQPTKIEGIRFFAADAVCGKDFTCVFGHETTGELLMLGPVGKDRFGVKANAPTSVPRWKQVAASWGSVFVLLESGELIGWGRGDHGQLPPRDLPFLKSIAAGSEHCIGLAAEHARVLAWGWGEHGNCGPHTDVNGDVKSHWNEMQTTSHAEAVFAGCATSFMETRRPSSEGETCLTG